MRTLKSSKEIDGVFRAGQRAGSPLILVIAADTPQTLGPQGRVAFIAGKKVGGAVTRNRLKRVLREAVHRAGGPWAGRDVLLIARRDLITASPVELDRALSAAISRLGLQ